MRIRTIKPEFWTDSLMVSMPRDVRLLYIGLWNVADDHGWLPDDAEQIRMLLFPGDPDADVGTWLEVLVACGRMERYSTPDERTILKIAHWKDHQRVDHPSQSKISREGSRKLAIPLSVRRGVAEKYGCAPGESAEAECYFCGAKGRIVWFRLHSGKPSSWVVFPDLELDHFVPEHSGGEAVIENIVLSCRLCNRSRCNSSAFEFFDKVALRLAKPREGSRLNGSGKGSGIRDQGMESSSPPYNEDPKEEQPETPNGDVTDALKAVEAVWSVWPKKVKTLEAKIAIRTAIARDGLDVVLAGTRAIVAAHGQQGPTPGRFLPDPVLFFGNSRYLDDPAQYAPREAVQSKASAMAEIKLLDEAIAKHLAHPAAAGYIRENVTKAMRDELEALRQKLAKAKAALSTLG